jgi:hypothetical protein
VIVCVLNTSLLPRKNNDSQTTDQLGLLAVEARRHDYWRPDRRVVAENEHAKCVLLETTNELLLEESRDTVQVLVMDDGEEDDEEGWWFLKNEEKLDVVDGHVQNNDKAPWYAAQRLVKDALGMHIPTPRISKAATNEMDIQQGQVPPNDNRQWTFLGRTQSQYGGDLYLYSYLLNEEQDVSDRANIISIQKSAIQQTLLRNRFANVKTIASIAMAMAYYGGAATTAEQNM